MNGVHRQRLTLVSLLIMGAVLAVTLVMFALSENINLFFSPSQMVRGEAPVGQTIRGGGGCCSRYGKTRPKQSADYLYDFRRCQ